MKKSITLLTIITILVCSKLVGEDAKDFFRRMMEYAHPTPVETFKELPAIPLSKPLLNTFFYNFATTVDETGTYQMQNESSIAVNPLNPKILIASAVDYRDTSATWVYISTNEGKTWINKKLGRPYPGWRSTNDPSVTFSYDGIAYLVYGGFGNISDTGIMYGENGVFLARSFDNGKTWEAHIPIIVHLGPQTLDSTFEDKYYITCDNSPLSPYRGNLYVPWKRVFPRDSATQIVISISTDKGSTWSVPKPISPRKPRTSEDTTFGQSFPLATIGPNGEVYVVWNDGVESGIGFAKSTDGGKTFSEPRIILKYKPFGTTKYITNQGYRHTVKGKVRAEAYPSITCDITSGPRKGYLYLTWSADPIPNVYFSYSSDGGETWSTPKIVHSDEKNDQFWQWIALDPTNGDIAVMYLDSRRDPDNLLVECWVSYSSDGGENWIDRPVSDVTTDLRLNPFSENSFAGDYSGCAFYNGKIFPSWVDMRASVKNIFDSDVYTAFISINMPTPPENFSARTIPTEKSAIQLTWDIPKSKVFGHPLNTNGLKYLLKRNGIEIATLHSNIVSFKDTGLAPYNLYTYSISSIFENDTSIEVHSKAYSGGAKQPLPPFIVQVQIQTSKSLALEVKIPSLRADSNTILVNLDSIIFYDEEKFLTSVSLSSTDTGLYKLIEFPVQEEGFYRIKAKIKDLDGNLSEFSNEKICFAGKITNLETEDFIDDFNSTKAKKYIKINGWEFANNFFVSSPSSITDSPFGNYPQRTEMILGTFPFILPNDGEVYLSFYNTAIIHRTDTGYVELVNFNQNSILLAKYNMEDFAPWKDKVLNKEDWRKELIKINVDTAKRNLGSEPVYIRFRLHSGTLGTDDGWYIDDLTISRSSLFAEDLSSTKVSVFPTPVVSYLQINSPTPIKSLSIFNHLGNKISVEEMEFKDSQTALLNVKNLANGTYFIFLSNGENDRLIVPFVIYR
ncbi:MAG: hypothetical protein N2517_04565 [Ignavibacteria bacterium]|nr:hypothetical protein [Ignavibacteria bacterium]